MPDNILGGQGATLLTAIIIVAVALLALVGVFWLMRARASSTFIRGGKNRQPRLAVLDAVAVDTRRRLVLIRRDDVEHLVMIGGPTDIVIESRIPQAGDGSDVSPPAPQKAPPPPQTAPPQQERFTQPAPPPRPAPLPRPAPPPRPVAPPMPQPQPRPPERAYEPEQVHAPPPPPPAPPSPPPAPPVAAAAPPVAVAAAPVAAAATGTIGSMRAEAADVLESARTRVFEEPSFDEDAFDELAGDPDHVEKARPAPAPPSPASPARFIDTPPAPPAEPAAPATPDFESVLAAELSEDMSFDLSDDDFLEQLDEEPQFLPDERDQGGAPEVRPEPQPSRDTLEAEMERLLGDLARKP